MIFPTSPRSIAAVDKAAEDGGLDAKDFEREIFSKNSELLQFCFSGVNKHHVPACSTRREFRGYVPFG